MFENQKKMKIHSKIHQNDSKILKLTPKIKIQLTAEIIKNIEIHQINYQSGTEMVKLNQKNKFCN